jgi:hypothetical protein
MYNIENKEKIIIIVLLTLIIAGSFYIINVKALDPQGPNSLNVTRNTTKGSTAPKIVNVSGGYIASINLSSTSQDPRWKGLVGYVTGKFSLDDITGSTLYDWTLSSVTGRLYVTRNSTSITWADINCSNFSKLNAENTVLNQTGPNDNLTITFNTTVGATHSGFFVGSVPIVANNCPTLNTYVNNVTQDSRFEEIALSEESNIVYATIIEPRVAGYSGELYDFQMIVPEVGTAGFTGATAYYVYIELS